MLLDDEVIKIITETAVGIEERYDIERDDMPSLQSSDLLLLNGYIILSI